MVLALIVEEKAGAGSLALALRLLRKWGRGRVWLVECKSYWEVQYRADLLTCVVQNVRVWRRTKRYRSSLRVLKSSQNVFDSDAAVVVLRCTGELDSHLLASDLFWDWKISCLINLRIGLVTANAYISTLGGGHYLCKQIDQAELMALHQLRVARHLGDPVLASQCRIHLAYNQMQRGNLKNARKRLRFEWAVAHVLDHSGLKSMVSSAWYFVRKLRSIREHMESPPQHENKALDPFYRQRFISALGQNSND